MDRQERKERGKENKRSLYKGKGDYKGKVRKKRQRGNQERKKTTYGKSIREQKGERKPNDSAGREGSGKGRQRHGG